MAAPNDRPQQVEDDEPPAAGQPFNVSLATVGHHPNTAILRALERGPMRFNDIVGVLTNVPAGIVNAALRELDGDGFVRRQVNPGPPLRVLYQLTPLGTQIAPSLHALGDWADERR